MKVNSFSLFALNLDEVRAPWEAKYPGCMNR